MIALGLFVPVVAVVVALPFALAFGLVELAFAKRIHRLLLHPCQMHLPK